MLRRLVVLLAMLAAMVMLATPAVASAGTQVSTTHFSSVRPLFIAPIPCSSLAGWNQIDENNGNGVLHFALNSNGFWATGTFEGDVNLLPATNVVLDANNNPISWDIDTSGTRPSAQGHVADWFGVSFNKTVVINHDVVNAQLTTSDGQAVSFHAIDHVQATPTNPPVITHQFSNFSCS